MCGQSDPNPVNWKFMPKEGQHDWNKANPIEIKTQASNIDFYELLLKTISEDEEVHIGIKNVKERISLMSDGSVEIISEIGKGTEIIIKIPRK